MSWRRGDWLAFLALTMAPLLVASPLIAGALDADPQFYSSGLAAAPLGEAGHFGLLAGLPVTDSNNGGTVQALGRLAAREWLSGRVPWWNPYVGVGLPLGAEYQPAIFSPLTLLSLLPQGMLWQHLALQILAGWGAYLFLRALRLTRLAAGFGGLLFAFNGTLAWFACASAMSAPYLPWMLWGIEQARASAAGARPPGWLAFAGAMTINILSGFPEAAYFNGLLTLAWYGVRLMQSPRAERFGFTWRVGAGGITALAVSAPQLWSFMQALPTSWVWPHAGHILANFHLASIDVIPSLFAPYLFGPIFAHLLWANVGGDWSLLGGYVTAGVLTLAVFGLLARRTATNWMLALWILLSLGKTFGFEPAVYLWNLIPGVADSAFARYAQSTWTLACVVLAAQGLNEIASGRRAGRAPLIGAAATSLVGISVCVVLLAHYWPALWPLVRTQHRAWGWMTGSLIWAFIVSTICLALAAGSSRRRAIALAGVLTLDAVVMYAIPTLSNTRDFQLETGGVEYLRRNLGLDRFYALGPLSPNYSAFYEIASLNYNYLPVDGRWANWVRAHLDQNTSPQMLGFGPRTSYVTSAAEELRRHLPEFELAGVRYIVTVPNHDPLEGDLFNGAPTQGNEPLTLDPDQSVRGIIPPSRIDQDASIERVGALVGTYGGAQGILEATVCSDKACVEGVADLDSAKDNTIVYVSLKTPLIVRAKGTVHYTFTYRGEKRIALWKDAASGATVAQTSVGSTSAEGGGGVIVRLFGRFASSQRVHEVYSDRVMRILKLPTAAPYFETRGGPCDVHAILRTKAVVDCRAPAVVVRRELYSPGWSARANGSTTRISAWDNIFQAVSVGGGSTTITYSYAPPGVLWAWIAMWAGLAIFAATCLSVFWSAKRRRSAVTFIANS